MAVPGAQLPPPLMTSEPGSFAERTIQQRKPSIIADILQHNDYPADIQADLEAFRGEIVGGAPVRSLREALPDGDSWRAQIAPYEGRSWFGLPWYLAETYFYRRVLEIVRYFQPGPWHLHDPFRAQKMEALGQGMSILAHFCDALPHGASLQDRHVRWLHRSLWGNRADLSNIGTRDRADDDGEDRADRLLVDHTARVWSRLVGGRVQRLDMVTDNAGPELVSDLGLIGFLLSNDLVGTVHVHLKAQPFFVSDALIVDWQTSLYALRASTSVALRDLSSRLNAMRDDDRLMLHDHPFWTTCLHYPDLHDDLRATLGQADLLLLKGDVNYRRLVSDAHWRPAAPLEEIASYMPAPFVTARTLKAEVIVGLAPGQAEEVAGRDPDWMIDGEWAVVHLVEGA